MSKKNKFPLVPNSEEIEAILYGHKTQARIPINLPVLGGSFEFQYMCWKMDGSGWEAWYADDSFFTNWESVDIDCPFGEPGTKYWVQEDYAEDGLGGACWFKAGVPIIRAGQWQGGFETHNPVYGNPVPYDTDWLPGKGMPEWASRLHVELIQVRAMPLHSITEAEIKAEGYTRMRCTPQTWFQHEWNERYGPGAYGRNPAVWIAEFKLGSDVVPPIKPRKGEAI